MPRQLTLSDDPVGIQQIISSELDDGEPLQT